MNKTGKKYLKGEERARGVGHASNTAPLHGIFKEIEDKEGRTPFNILNVPERIYIPPCNSYTTPSIVSILKCM